MASTKTINLDHSLIQKLTLSENYPLWKLSVENIVWAADIHGILLGTETRHAADADAQLKWDMGSRAGMGVILQTVKQSLTSHVFSCSTSKEMWDTLEATFGKSTSFSKQELLQEFFSLSLDDQTPTELVNQLQCIVEQSRNMGYMP
jgi:hypothetical protein